MQKSLVKRVRSSSDPTSGPNPTPAVPLGAPFQLATLRCLSLGPLMAIINLILVIIINVIVIIIVIML